MTWLNKKFWLLTLTLAVGLVVSTGEVKAQYSSSGTPDHPDAIAVRVIPNPNHYSIVRWYESQGFVGSPQTLTVDGYEAIRDGRTVYINAANVDPATKNIYTNIYLISYNQDSVAPTVDILGQLISRWKFNSNLTESGVPTCSFSSLSCQNDTDCGDNQTCSTSGSTAGSCLLKTAKNCLVDTDCPASFFCSSLKAKIARDIKRVGRLEELSEALASFRRVNSRYPILAAGTYLPGHSISVWPSWPQELLSNLAVSPNFRDPVNRLGPCVPYGGSGVSDGYDPTTCWNATDRKFINEPSGADLALPAGSYAFIYSTDFSGASYNLCATMESRSLGFRFSPNDPAGSSCLVATGIGSGGLSANTAPHLLDQLMIGEPNKEFNGYIRVTDAEGDILSWSWASQGGHHSEGWRGWISGGQNNQAPRLLDTSNPYQKKVYAERAGGEVGTYNLTLRVSDGLGGVLTTSTPITIVSDPIILEASDAEYEPDAVNSFSYRFSFSGNGFSNPTVNTPVITLVSGPYNLFSILSGLNKSISLSGGKYQVEYRGTIPTSYQFFKDTVFRYRISLTDSFGKTAQKQFSVTVKSVAPTLNFSCASSARLGKYYSCLLGGSQQGNHVIDYYGTSGYPAGFFINPKPSGVYLVGSSTTLSSDHNVVVKAKNEYGASSTKAFTVSVNNYCGDGIRQYPNTEGRGGLYNDGYEDCDGTDHVVSDPNLSSFEFQYGCSTTASSPKPYPILTNDQCVFLSPSAGGGYKGDGYCQVAYENKTTSPADCDDTLNGNCIPDCTNRACGNDGCGGSCGICLNNKVCSPAGSCVNSACSGNTDCDDLNPCTVDTCSNPGAGNATCIHSANVGHVEACVGFTWYDNTCFGCEPNCYQDCLYDCQSHCADLPPPQQPQCNASCTGSCDPDCSSNCGACSTGTCRVSPTRSCNGTVFGSCDSVDPRIAYCANKCEGESNAALYGGAPGLCNAGNHGVCLNTDNGDACSYMGEVKSCYIVLGWPSGSWIGNATCNSSCTGYDTSSCVPHVCDAGSSTVPAGCYWYKVPEAEDSYLTVGTTCMVKMNVNNGNGNVICSEAAVGPGAQWFRGSIAVSGTAKYCSLTGCAEARNPNKCRYYAGGWTNNCYVHKTW